MKKKKKLPAEYADINVETKKLEENPKEKIINKILRDYKKKK